MEIRLLANDEISEYDCLAREHGSLFNASDWLALFEGKILVYGIFDKAQRMIGGFSLYQDRKCGLKIIRRAPFTPNLGPFYRSLSTSPVARLEEQRTILAAMAGFIDKEKAFLSMIPLPLGLSDALPFYWRNYKVIPAITYLIDLSRPMDILWRDMSGVRRNDIRKAQRDHLTVERIVDMQIVRSLVISTFERQKKRLDRVILDNILFDYARPDNSYAFVSYRGSIPVATSFVVYDRLTAYYLLGGYNSNNGHHGAGAWAIWEAIKYAQSLGIRTFDFEGSVIPAIERFFRGFGGKPTAYFTVNKGWMGAEIALKTLKRNIF